MNIYRIFSIIVISLLFMNRVMNAQPIYKFAVIGDFGDDNQAEADVASLVNSWDVSFILTVGDNFYGATDGNYNTSWNALDDEVGKYYNDWIKPYLGTYGSGSPDMNRFFPALGNHDWYHLDSSKVYEDYFDLTPYNTTSGNERYYDFVWENVHFYVLSTYGNGLTEYSFPRHNNYGEPDGVVQNSKQAQWLKTQLENSDPSHWNIVITHQPPYSSSSQHGSEPAVQWPYKDWGTDLVLCGHDHTYERLNSNGLTYIVNGLGGESIYQFGSPVSQSEFRYNSNYGAMLFEVYTDSINFKFISRTGLLVDDYTLSKFVSNTDKQDLGTINGFYLAPNYPNPFNPSTKIRYTISGTPNNSARQAVSLKVYDILGIEVATLVDEQQSPGNYEVEFNLGKNTNQTGNSLAYKELTSGIYFYRLVIGKFIQTRKMVLIK